MDLVVLKMAAGQHCCSTSIHLSRAVYLVVARRSLCHQDLRVVPTMELLDEIVDELVDQTRIVSSMMNRATQALLTCDLDMAQNVISTDSRLDTLRSEVSDKAIRYASAHSAAATDLRILMSATSIAASFERMGDLAVHVAKFVPMRYPRHAVPEDLTVTIRRAGQVCVQLAETVGRALSERDMEAAQETFAIDDELDLIHRELFMIVLGPDWREGAETTVDITLLSRFYERFGDHAVSVARRLIHIVTGHPFTAPSE